jgi:lysozyme family protein
MNFLTAVERCLSHEGGYVDNPNDPGGETKFGISKRSYPNVNIKNLTREGAIAIYKTDFWDRVKGDRLYDGVAYQLFDFAINSGAGTAIRHLQKALDVADDGYWGPISQKAADSMSETDQIMRLIAHRQLFQAKLSIWRNFGKGWAIRNAENLLYGAIDS